MLPAEGVWYFTIRHSASKQLFFDESETLIKVVYDLGALLAKADKTDDDKQLIDVCLHGVEQPTISRVPFSHLVASYQASLKDIDQTLAVIRRTEYEPVVDEDAEIIRSELSFIDEWLNKWASDDVKFEPAKHVNPDDFSDQEKQYMSSLADKIVDAPEDADGAWFHLAIYGHKESTGMQPKELFTTLYRALIDKDSGPRAGWFLSILPRDWLIKRLRLEA